MPSKIAEEDIKIAIEEALSEFYSNTVPLYVDATIKYLVVSKQGIFNVHC